MSATKEIETVEDLTTSDDLQAQIEALQAQKAKLEAKENETEVEKITLPVADVVLQLNKFNTVIVKEITPPQLAFLVAEHHRASGGRPVVKINRCLDPKTNEPRTIQVDPRLERMRLAMIYSQKKVMVMYPGLVPQFPKTFASATQSGLATTLPTERLMDFTVSPFNNQPQPN